MKRLSTCMILLAMLFSFACSGKSRNTDQDVVGNWSSQSDVLVGQLILSIKENKTFSIWQRFPSFSEGCKANECYSVFFVVDGQYVIEGGNIIFKIGESDLSVQVTDVRAGSAGDAVGISLNGSHFGKDEWFAEPESKVVLFENADIDFLHVPVKPDNINFPLDSDSDTIFDVTENFIGSDPQSSDSDQDGIMDENELSSTGVAIDSDLDGVPNILDKNLVFKMCSDESCANKYGLALDDDYNFYTTDSNFDGIKIYTKEGELKETKELSGVNNHFELSPSGDIYAEVMLSDKPRYGVRVFSLNGDLKGEFSPVDPTNSSSSVTIGDFALGDNGNCYVVYSPKVYVYDSEYGNVDIIDVGKPHIGAISTAPNGNLYIIANDNPESFGTIKDKILVYSPDGNLISEIETSIHLGSELKVDENENIYVLDMMNGIHKFNKEGTYVGKITDFSLENDAGLDFSNEIFTFGVTPKGEIFYLDKRYIRGHY